MLFWIKNVVLTLLLLLITAYLLVGDPTWFQSKGHKEETPKVVKKEEKPKPKPTRDIPKPEEPEIAGDGGTFEMTTSSAATGLSRFYGKVKEELLGNNKTIGDGYVIKLKPPVFSVEEQLIRRSNFVKPGSPKFTGETQVRHFRQGETIRNQLLAAAQQEGMELIWQLERDYIIKHYFKVDANLLSTLSTVAQALNSDFEKDVYALYCYSQRAVVITHEYNNYIQENCRHAKPEPDPEAVEE